MKRNDRGSITVEATIFLTMYFCAFMFFMEIVNMVKVQSIIQYSIDQTAKEISAYSYVLTKAKVTGAIKKTSKAASEFQYETEKVVSSVEDFAGKVQSGGDIGGMIESGTTAFETIENYAENTDIFAGVVNCLKSEAEGYVTTTVIGKVAKARLKQHLECGVTDADKYLESLGVVDGLDGIDFSKSKWIVDGKPTLRITAIYEMKGQYMWFEILGDRKFKVNATTGIW